MDVFRLRDKIVDDYLQYITSFLKILDPKIETFVNNELKQGVLWPDALLQLSPAYQPAQTIQDLADSGLLHSLCADIFRKSDNTSLLLHQHQRTALELAAKNQNYVVTTGTGSGKSLTYILPVFDFILKNNPAESKVRAIIVYPMNALINSQEQALNRFVQNLPGGEESCPVRYARYTGQESNARKREIQQNPPHILLTNYVMLELMLTRPEESRFVDATTSALQFLVLDELHTYRGRQGADVAYLVRRLRERSGNPNLQCIGTSATMSAGSTREERSQEIAAVASRIFGTTLNPTNVIDETLRRVITPTVGTNNDPTTTRVPDNILRNALTTQTPLATNPGWEIFRQHPLARWIEEKFGLELDKDGKLKRPIPVTLMDGAEELAQRTGIEVDTCAAKLQHFFNWGSKVRSPEGIPGFAFKLHQFFSQGDAVYATLETSATRYLTLSGQIYAPGQGQQTKLLFPLVFCRECGQEYYLCIHNNSQDIIIPRPPFSREPHTRRGETTGYLVVDSEGFWSNESSTELLPDTWFKELKSGRTLKKEYENYKPQQFWVEPDGNICSTPNTATATKCWFIPVPFMTCLRCGEVYTKRQGEFSKLARLSSEGRSTSTTLLGVSSVVQMRNDQTIAPQARKLLSFTDNRQDASLQAGHFNDFIEVTQLRSAIYQALKKATTSTGCLGHANIATEVVNELALPEKAFAKESAPNPRSPLARRNRQALQNLVEYRIYEDLRRGWRFLQPNLEQAGLLVIDYEGLEDLAQDEAAWQTQPLFAQALPQTRLIIMRAVLDYMRRELAISAACLERSQQETLVKRVRETLNESWAFDENEQLYGATRFVLPGTAVTGYEERSLGTNTSLGRYLKTANTWGIQSLQRNLNTEEYTELIGGLVGTLRGWGILGEVDAVEGKDKAVQLRSDCLMWRAGDGQTLIYDPIRRRRMTTAYERTAKPNKYFAQLYQTSGANLNNIESREHTGQVQQHDREEREEKFRQGDLAVLFCSPTMELGIDIATLNMVHMRNVPPTPANYAQRSGRAGRSGTPALVATYCSVGSGHDQYFFRQPAKMVSGVVVPPRLDLANEELIKAHIHAVWLSLTGLSLGRSMIELVDTSNPAAGYPLHQSIQEKIELDPTRQQECFEVCQRILGSSLSPTLLEQWESQLKKIIRLAPTRFDEACQRWRNLYDTAERQLLEARNAIDRRFQSRKTGTQQEAQEAERREREANRQKKLLCNDTEDEQGDTDFYPYRYFASEGFLPGYNFPRLPVQAFLPTGRENGTFLARPRFLALIEFGPRNIIYHEGAKYRIVKVMLGAGGAESRMITAKLCHNCGFFHEGANALQLDMCEYCGVFLKGENSLTTRQLFELTTVSTQRVERITSEEEERSREGFHVTTHYRWSKTHPPSKAQVVAGNNPDTGSLLTLNYAPAATVWRINHRWRRATKDGFTLDTRRGIWAKKPDEEVNTDQSGLNSEPGQLLSGVRLLVRDTRNVLLVLPDLISSTFLLPGENSEIEGFLASLQYALQRGIETIFQVEEQELASERIGEGKERRLLLWEAAEGGVGVLVRLAEDETTLAKVAREALRICHFDPQTGEDKAIQLGHECERACYHCLLAYSNQTDHRLLNRQAIREALLDLANSRTITQTTIPGIFTAPATHSITADENKLAETTTNLAPGSPGNKVSETTPAAEKQEKQSFARKVLEYLQNNDRQLPDAYQPALEDTSLRPDFFYEVGAICVFCDEIEPAKSVRLARAELADMGYRVIVLRADENLEKQLTRWADVFGQ